MKCRVWILAFLLVGFAAATAAPRAHGAEPLAVIVNRSNPVENLSMEDLRKYCLQQRKHWENNKRATIVLREPGQAEREAVLELIYRMSESDFNRYFLQGEFTGEVQGAPKHLSTAVGVRRFVFNVPGAIGFARLGDVDNTVKVLRINGYAPGDPQYPLHLVY